MATRKQKIPDDCMPKCASCAFFDIEPKDEFGFCRRYPATPIILDNEVEMVIPVMAPEEWCGEFVRRTS